MKLVFASDSFKGSLSAARIAELLSEEARACFGEAACVSAPVADGGEGTVEALLSALGGELVRVTVTGPMGEPTVAEYARTPDGLAIMEMAQASGLPLVRRKNPLRATSLGTGEMLAHALAGGCRRVLMGLGGSATNDGGAGMLQALGARLLDEAGQAIGPGPEGLEALATADFSTLLPALADAEIDVLCDVTNPLLGERGATAVYGPQKGVTEALQPRVERAMENCARVFSAACGRDVASFAGAGAAGGMGAALGGVLGARMKRGVDAVLDAVGFDALLDGCDLVVTGEGRMDGQSVRFGKAVAGVAARADAKGVPVLAIVGSMAEGAEDFLVRDTHSVMTTVNGVMPLEEALANAEALYRQAARRAFRLVRIGQARP